MNVVVREADPSSVAVWLDPTQKECFEASCQALLPRRDDVIARLALPPRDAWPETWPMPEVDALLHRLSS